MCAERCVLHLEDLAVDAERPAPRGSGPSGRTGVLVGGADARAVVVAAGAVGFHEIGLQDAGQSVGEGEDV